MFLFSQVIMKTTAEEYSSIKREGNSLMDNIKDEAI
jgi:hypothetical protein